MAAIICFPQTNFLPEGQGKTYTKKKKKKRSHKIFSEWYPLSESAQQCRNRVPGNQLPS